jgi:hypothetical protein
MERGKGRAGIFLECLSRAGREEFAGARAFFDQFGICGVAEKFGGDGAGLAGAVEMVENGGEFEGVAEGQAVLSPEFYGEVSHDLTENGFGFLEFSHGTESIGELVFCVERIAVFGPSRS